MKKVVLLVTLLIVSSILFELNAQTNEIDSLENLLKKLKKEDTARVKLLNKTAYKLRKFDLKKTQEYAKEAGELADKINFVKGKAESLRIIGIYHYYISDYPVSIKYYNKSTKISEKH